MSDTFGLTLQVGDLVLYRPSDEEDQVVAIVRQILSADRCLIKRPRPGIIEVDTRTLTLLDDDDLVDDVG